MSEAKLTLSQLQEGTESVIKEITAQDEELVSFLFSLGCKIFVGKVVALVYNIIQYVFRGDSMDKANCVMVKVKGIQQTLLLFHRHAKIVQLHLNQQLDLLSNVHIL